MTLDEEQVSAARAWAYLLGLALIVGSAAFTLLSWRGRIRSASWIKLFAALVGAFGVTLLCLSPYLSSLDGMTCLVGTALTVLVAYWIDTRFGRKITVLVLLCAVTALVYWYSGVGHVA